MMQVHLEDDDSRFIIQSYSNGESVTINGNSYTKPLIISRQTLIHPWRPNTVDELEADDFNAVIEMQPKILLIGTGEQNQLLPHALLAELHQARIGIECMDTGAACRTYSALSSEGRSVVAALFIHTHE